MAEITTVKLGASDGPPTVEIEIGHAQFGKYELSLFDTDGRNPVVVGAGLSHDRLPDSFQIDGDPRALNGRFLSWSANLIPAGDEQNGTQHRQADRAERIARGDRQVRPGCYVREVADEGHRHHVSAEIGDPVCSEIEERHRGGGASRDPIAEPCCESEHEARQRTSDAVCRSLGNCRAAERAM